MHHTGGAGLPIAGRMPALPVYHRLGPACQQQAGCLLSQCTTASGQLASSRQDACSPSVPPPRAGLPTAGRMPALPVHHRLGPACRQQAGCLLSQCTTASGRLVNSRQDACSPSAPPPRGGLPTAGRMPALPVHHRLGPDCQQQAGCLLSQCTTASGQLANSRQEACAPSRKRTRIVSHHPHVTDVSDS